MSEFDNNQNNPNTPLEGENKTTETENPKLHRHRKTGTGCRNLTKN